VNKTLLFVTSRKDNAEAY